MEVVHDKGTTTIPSRPLRVVALDGSLVGAVAGLDVDVVGYTLDVPELPGYFQGDRTAGGVAVGTLAEPSIERIAALQPDLIVSSTVRHDALYPALSRIAPTVFTATTGPTWKDNIRLVAQALGRSRSAEEQLPAYEARARAVGAAIAAGSADPTISLVRFVGPGKPARLYGNASFPGIVLADAGLARPAVQDVDEFMVEISPEQIELAEGDRIFYTDPALDENASDTSMADFTGNDLWNRLTGEKTAVADDRWYSSVSVQGAHLILDDLAAAFGVDPQV
ncbi:iron-siderophore ABC transporter substrate-binding protein [Nakamurella flavida]|uniref:Iron-siderophore ABC transporter substrate-binding protein n=1 Tax=Nakamurella flavida TaxID=363630 RepID=A0A939C2R2_9ACTN|nr:iron-siderophore ABC transporter substrate-binding protein [Nakamurella flavida]MBM9476850.1 iron-siderophore ABC transporter substrate-binding protein [Nakamurella flavida]MDP9778707.1 iron complex transport system substrate-binding protein [Nakamurella flavida]